MATRRSLREENKLLKQQLEDCKNALYKIRTTEAAQCVSGLCRLCAYCLSLGEARYCAKKMLCPDFELNPEIIRKPMQESK